MSDDKPLPTAPVRRGRDREVMVGLFVIAGFAATLIALFMLTDASMFRGRYVLTTVLKDAAGIRKGDPVLMRGVNIGRVQKFDIDKDKVAIRLEVEGEYKIPRDSRVEVRSQGLLGSMVADVIPGQSSEMAARRRSPRRAARARGCSTRSTTCRPRPTRRWGGSRPFSPTRRSRTSSRAAPSSTPS